MSGMRGDVWTSCRVRRLDVQINRLNENSLAITCSPLVVDRAGTSTSQYSVRAGGRREGGDEGDDRDQDENFEEVENDASRGSVTVPLHSQLE